MILKCGSHRGRFGFAVSMLNEKRIAICNYPLVNKRDDKILSKDCFIYQPSITVSLLRNATYKHGYKTVLLKKKIHDVSKLSPDLITVELSSITPVFLTDKGTKVLFECSKRLS